MKKDNKDKIYTCYGCDYYYCDTFNGIREKYPTRHCGYKSHRDCWFKQDEEQTVRSDKG
jgi:hypothetical protein